MVSQKTTGRKPTPTATSLANLRRGGGRPKGVPNKNTREIKAAAKAFLERPAYLASLKRRVDAGEAPHMETLLHHYAYGKPKESMDISVTAAVAAMSDNELFAHAEALIQGRRVRRD